MKDYLKTTVMPYIQTYLKSVFKAHSKRSYDMSSYTGVCYTATLPASEQKVQEADLVILVTTMTKSSSTLAAATFCQLATSNKRPVLGEVLINTETFKYDT